MILRTNRIFNLNISWFTTMSLPTLLAVSFFLVLTQKYSQGNSIYFLDGENEWIIFSVIEKFGGVKVEF